MAKQRTKTTNILGRLFEKVPTPLLLFLDMGNADVGDHLEIVCQIQALFKAQSGGIGVDWVRTWHLWHTEDN